MRNNERTAHPSGSLGPGSRRNANRVERHRQGNTLRLVVHRQSWDDYEEPEPKPARDFAAAGRMAEVL